MLWSMSDDIAVRAEDLTKFYGTRRGRIQLSQAG
jgi:hypothetical protein